MSRMNRVMANLGYISVLLWLCGIAGLLGLPFASKRIKLDENGLMPLLSVPSEQRDPIHLGHLNFSEIEVAETFLQQHGFTAYGHTFNATLNASHSSGRFKSNISCKMLTSIIHAQENPQNDALLVISNLEMFPKLVHLMQLLEQVGWLAKNVVFAFTDQACEDSNALDQWLFQYHGEVATSNHIQSGNIIAAIVLDFIADNAKSLEISMNAGEGVLPNLDLVTLFRTVARDARGGGFHLHFKGMESYRETWTCHPKSIDEYYLQMKSLFAFYRNHFQQQNNDRLEALRRYAIDAIHVSSKRTLRSRKSTLDTFSEVKVHYDILSICELFIRSLNNLEEKLHHSEYMYLLASSTCYVPIICIAPSLTLLISIALIPLGRVWVVSEYETTRENRKGMEENTANAFQRISATFCNVLYLYVVSLIYALLSTFCMMMLSMNVGGMGRQATLIFVAAMHFVFSILLAVQLKKSKSENGIGIFLVSIITILYVAELFQSFGMVSVLSIALFPFHLISNSKMLRRMIVLVLAYAWLGCTLVLMARVEGVDFQTHILNCLHAKAGSKDWWLLFGVVTPSMIGATAQTFAHMYSRESSTQRRDKIE